MKISVVNFPQEELNPSNEADLHSRLDDLLGNMRPGEQMSVEPVEDPADRRGVFVFCRGNDGKFHRYDPWISVRVAETLQQFCYDYRITIPACTPCTVH